jgi:hypothetical protein
MLNQVVHGILKRRGSTLSGPNCAICILRNLALCFSYMNQHIYILTGTVFFRNIPRKAVILRVIRHHQNPFRIDCLRVVVMVTTPEVYTVRGITPSVTRRSGVTGSYNNAFANMDVLRHLSLSIIILRFLSYYHSSHIPEE